MAKSRPVHTPEQIARAFESIRRLRRLGEKSLKRTPTTTYADRSLEREAGELGISVDTLRRARHLADPARGGYTTERLDRLFEECRAAGFALTRTHLSWLLSVPEREQVQLERRVIKQRWSAHRLARELAKRHGARRAGGRRPRVPDAGADILIRLAALAATWAHWHTALHREPGPGKPAPAAALSEGVRDQLSRATRALLKLRAIVEEELAREVPGRKAAAPERPPAARGRGRKQAGKLR